MHPAHGIGRVVWRHQYGNCAAALGDRDPRDLARAETIEDLQATRLEFGGTDRLVGIHSHTPTWSSRLTGRME
jgi:hypothetical protein